MDLSDLPSRPHQMPLWVRPHPHQKRSLRLKNNWRPINPRPAPPPCRIQLARRRQKPRRQKYRQNPAQNCRHRPARLPIQTGPRRSRPCLGTMTRKIKQTRTRATSRQPPTQKPRRLRLNRRRLPRLAPRPSHQRHQPHRQNWLRSPPHKHRPVSPGQHLLLKPRAILFPAIPDPWAPQTRPCRNIANRLLHRHLNQQRRSPYSERTGLRQRRSNPPRLNHRNPNRTRPSRKTWPMPSR